MLGNLAIWEWRSDFATCLGILAIIGTITLLMDLRLENFNEEYAFQNAAPPRRVAVAAALLVTVVLFSASQSNAFIYFQF